MKPLMHPYIYAHLPRRERQMVGSVSPSRIIDSIGRYFFNIGHLDMCFNRMNIHYKDRNYKTLLESKRRIKPIIEMKYAMIYHLKNNTGLTLNGIGALMGGLHHSTVLHGYREWSAWKDTDKSIARINQKLERVLS